MGLSEDLISQFVKITNDKKDTKQETTVYATVVESEGKKYVQIDGSDLLTPVSATATARHNDRVTVMIKNHTATITGNISSPSAMASEIVDLDDAVVVVRELLADKVNTDDFIAEKANIDELQAANVEVLGRLEANEAEIETLKATNFEAVSADIEQLKAKDVAIEGRLESAEGVIENLGAVDLSAVNAEIDNLKTGKLDAKTAEVTYANIDFANIGEAAIRKIFSDSGLIHDLVVGNGTITGLLVGVTIKGDQIEANTVVADKLVVKGDDGLYYKLNTDGVTTEAEQTDRNSLDGSVILAKSITATKITVDDLVAFGATIGGFNLSESAIFSGTKSSVDNTTDGVYMDREGQFAVGNGFDYIKFFKDADGNYKLNVSADAIVLRSEDNLEDAIDNASKSATNYLQYDGTNGLQIGNRTTGAWSGFRTQITNRAFRILSQTGSVLASYGEKLIELGKNATDAVIKLCGGKGTIQYVTDEEANTEYLEVTADKIRVKSEGSDAMSSLYSLTDEDSGWLSKSSVNVTPGSVDIYVSYCHDPSLPDKIESWTNHGMQINPDIFRIYADVPIEVEANTAFTKEIYDRFGTKIHNGLAAYGGANNMIDANTTSESLILTTVNTPDDSLWYVETMFYNDKNGNRAQRATPYRFDGPSQRRYYYNGTWSTWTDSHNHTYVTSAGGFRFAQGWMGIYDSMPNASTHTSRKGYLGYDGGESLVIADQVSGGIDLKSGGTIRFYGGGNGTNFVGILNDRMVPSANDAYYSGDSSRRWKAVYAVNGTIQTSDRNLKTDISDINDKYIRLFDILKPVTFRFSDPESDRVHIGYISQDVEEAMAAVGLSDLEFAGFCKDVSTENGEDVYSYSLRYSEFIALNSKIIQLNRQKIAEQQTQIDTLRTELDELRQFITSKIGVE